VIAAYESGGAGIRARAAADPAAIAVTGDGRQGWRRSSPSSRRMRTLAAERLARYKCPPRVEWVEALPRNPSGKVLRRELRAPYWQQFDRQVG